MHLSILANLAISTAVILSVPAYVSLSFAQGVPEAALMKSANEGGVRRWGIGTDVASIHAAPSAAADSAATVSKGEILQNRGCSDIAGQVWCEVRSLRGNVRGYVLAGQLRPAKGPDGIVAMGMDDSRQRADKRDFDAEAIVPCAQEQGQSLGKCDAAVARGVGGDATVIVTFQNGFARKLYFVHGAFVKASATMSGVGTDMDWHLENKVHRVRVDDQRFELSDRFVFGK